MLGVGRAHAAGDGQRARAGWSPTSRRAAAWTGSWRCCPTRPASPRWRRRAHGLTGPELATLLAHAKLDLTAQVLATRPARRGGVRRRGCRSTSRARCASGSPTRSPAHPLRREIVTTLLVNEMVDGAGMTYAFRLGEELAAEPGPTRCAPTRSPPRCSTCPSCGQRAARRRTIPTAVSDELVLDSRRLLDRAVALVPHQPAAAAGGRRRDHPVRRAVSRELRARAAASCCAGASCAAVDERRPRSCAADGRAGRAAPLRVGRAAVRLRPARRRRADRAVRAGPRAARARARSPRCTTRCPSTWASTWR